jgi:hypothetical protein
MIDLWLDLENCSDYSLPIKEYFHWHSDIHRQYFQWWTLQLLSHKKLMNRLVLTFTTQRRHIVKANENTGFYGRVTDKVTFASIIAQMPFSFESASHYTLA